MALLARRTRFAIVASLLTGPAPLAAQIRASERSTISQTIDGAVITLDYARPRARGRDSLFGGVVKWAEVWTPGANWATTLEVTRDVTLDGHPVPKGKYSVWIVIQPEEWTLVLDPRAHLFHTAPPDSTADQVRYRIHPVAGLFTEVLTWSFPDVQNGGATLMLAWGREQVTLAVKVEPAHPLTIARDSVRAYLGRYRFRWTGDADTVKSSQITLSHDHGMLMGKWEPAPDSDLASFALIRIADGWFSVAEMRRGEIFEVDPDWVIEFPTGAGQATGFELRGEKDKLEGSAVRER